MGVGSSLRNAFSDVDLKELKDKLLIDDGEAEPDVLSPRQQHHECGIANHGEHSSASSKQPHPQPGLGQVAYPLSTDLRTQVDPDKIVIEGDHDLGEVERRALLRLEELQHCKKLKLEKPNGVKRTSVYFMSPVNLNGDPMLPTVIKIKESEKARKEFLMTVEGRTHYGDYAMRLIDFVVEDRVGVLQLEISGSRCCIPRFVDAVKCTVEYGERFTAAVSAVENANSNKNSSQALELDRVLNMANEIFATVLRPCVFRTAEAHYVNNFLEMLEGKGVKKRLLGKAEDTKFGPDYFDGLSSLAAYGGILDDVERDAGSDISILSSMVESLTGRWHKPSEFFSEFYKKIEGIPPGRLAMWTVHGIVHNDLHFGNVMVDADDRLWIIDLETVSRGHVFTDLAKGLGSALFCYSGDMPEEEVQTLQTLMLIWASAPDNIVEMAMPLAPEGVKTSTRCRWGFSRQMQRHFASFSAPPQRRAADGQGGGGEKTIEAKMDKACLQMLWAVFTTSVQMATYKQNKEHPRCKRMALYLSIAVAARILHEFSLIQEPPWLRKHTSMWVKFRDMGNEDTNLGSLLERYSVIVRSKEAWVRDPFTHQRFDVLHDTVDVRLHCLGTNQATGFKEASGYTEVCEMLRTNQKMLVVGAPGSGKTVLTKQVVTHLLDEEKSGNSLDRRLPLRIPLIDLSPRNQGQPDEVDLGTYIRNSFEESIAMIVNEARYSAGLILVMDGLDEADPEKTWIVSWIKELLQNEPKHLILITTRPSAFEVKARNTSNPLYRWWTKQKAANSMKFTHEQVKADGFVLCEIQEFGKRQLEDLSKSRLGPDVAEEIRACLTQPAYKDLVRMPLLATMVMHMILQKMEHNDNRVLTHYEVYSFAFQQLVTHIDAAKRRIPKEYDSLINLDKAIVELAYRKQSNQTKTIKEEDFCADFMGEIGTPLWKIARSGQLALFEVNGTNLQFFHLTMQEYLSARHTLDLLHGGLDWPAWLMSVDEFAMGAHHFFGALAEHKGFTPSVSQKEKFRAKNHGPQAEVIKLLRKAFAIQDDFAIDGIFSVLSIAQIAKMELDLSCADIGNDDRVSPGLAKLDELESLTLKFKYCFNLTKVGKLAEACQEFSDLLHLTLDFTACPNLRSCDKIGNGLLHLRQLQHLDLRFKACTSIKSVDELGKGLRVTTELAWLNLDFEQCQNLTSIAELGKGLAGLVKLEVLSVNFMGCLLLTGAEEIGKGLAQLQRLRQLALRFRGSNSAQSLHEVCRGISKITGLTWLSVDRRVSTSFNLSTLTCRNVVVMNITATCNNLKWILLWMFFVGQFIFLISMNCDLPSS